MPCARSGSMPPSIERTKPATCSDLGASTRALCAAASARSSRPKISSLGVRAFEYFVQALPADVVLVHVSPAIASQLTMIPNLCGVRTTVESAKLPFTWLACGAEKSHSVPFHAGANVEHAPKCACGAVMELDGLPEQYLPM